MRSSEKLKIVSLHAKEGWFIGSDHRVYRVRNNDNDWLFSTRIPDFKGESLAVHVVAIQEKLGLVVTYNNRGRRRYAILPSKYDLGGSFLFKELGEDLAFCYKSADGVVGKWKFYTKLNWYKKDCARALYCMLRSKGDIVDINYMKKGSCFVVFPESGESVAVKKKYGGIFSFCGDSVSHKCKIVDPVVLTLMPSEAVLKKQPQLYWLPIVNRFSNGKILN